MMLYEQAANDDNCPEKSGANVLLILGHFQKCLTAFFIISILFKHYPISLHKDK